MALILVPVLVLVAVILAPRSRRWHRLNRLHRLAVRNERTLRRAERAALNRAVRTLETAHRDLLERAQPAVARDLDVVLRKVVVTRDLVNADLIPSVANFPQGRPVEVSRSAACDELEELCDEIARSVRARRSVEQGQLRELASAAEQAAA